MPEVKSVRDIDKYAGARLRMRRMQLHLSQTELADAVGLTFQQIQKYEKGANRISTSRLQQFADFLKVPPSFFFGQGHEHSATDKGFDIQTGLLTNARGVRLATAFMKISDPRLQESFVLIGEQLAAISDRKTMEAQGDL